MIAKIAVQAPTLVSTSHIDSNSISAPASAGTSIPSVWGQRANMAGPYSGVNLAISSRTPPSGMNKLPKNAKRTRNPEAALTAVSERNNKAKASPYSEKGMATATQSAAELSQ